MTVITLGELLDAGVHFGHQSSRWNPKMFPYIYAEQNGIHVIDLVQTARLLTHAHNYVQKAAKEGKKFLFIGTKRQAAGIIAFILNKQNKSANANCTTSPCHPSTPESKSIRGNAKMYLLVAVSHFYWTLLPYFYYI